MVLGVFGEGIIVVIEEFFLEKSSKKIFFQQIGCRGLFFLVIFRVYNNAKKP